MAATARADLGTAGRLVRSGLWLAGAVAAANILNAAFQVVLARALTPGEYSLAVTLFAAVMVLGVPALAVQTAVARDVAARLAIGDRPGAGLVLRESSRSLLYVCAALVPAALAVGIPAAYALNVQHPLPLVATAAVVGFSLALSVVWGGLQGSSSPRRSRLRGRSTARSGRRRTRPPPNASAPPGSRPSAAASASCYLRPA